ncbi:MAG: trna-splicing endonuclease subunit sen-15 [Lasallia pustulata]|uniref:Trna-splicing endonuclease subunit sen-15 n=1 Tax=Lasallia pustulata TaxID=136370 RepID=A0A5M8PH71_9LECA|nr:MAG: trna-splicing endonuclease subunit sen-15 [Lasallia pustulata]
MLKAGVEEADVEVEREWVVPTHLREKWSLRRFAEVFDAVGEVPEARAGVDVGAEGQRKGAEGKSDGGEGATKKRRGGKRVLLATLNDDSTVVYYILLGFVCADCDTATLPSVIPQRRGLPPSCIRQKYEPYKRPTS